MFSCNNAAVKSKTEQQPVDSQQNKVAETSKPSAKKISGVYKWTGTINNSIPVFMWFALKDSIIKGELVYLKTKNQLRITIIGTVDEEGCRIHEFESNGNITGNYVGKINNNEFSGSWYGTASRKEMTFQFATKDTSIVGTDTVFQPSINPGLYSYQFGKEGRQGGLKLEKENEGLISLDINCVTGAPAYNIAEATPDSIVVKDNTAEFKIADTKCPYKLRLFKDFLVIKHVNAIYDCGFGNNADIDGVFLRTKGVEK